MVQQSFTGQPAQGQALDDSGRAASRFYEFGPFQIDARDRLLFREQQLVSLPLKVFETLQVLVESHGQVLEKPYLVKRLWPNTYVGSRSLAQNIFTLRKVLGGDHSQFIETVPRRGYRFLAPVKMIDGEPAGMDWRTAGHAKRMEPAGDAFSIRLVAVLPFKPLGEDTEGNYLGAGLADALITRLSAIEGVIVRPTSAIADPTASTQDLMLIGQELGVDSLIDGRIQRSGDKIRVTAQLINVHNGAPLWADKFDGRLEDIFSLQDAISERVAQALTLKLSAGKARRVEHGTENAAAYQLYLKGRFHWNRRTPQGFRKAIQCFEQAIEQDPEYALALAGLADCHILLNFYGSAKPKESYRKAFAAAGRAIEIDPGLVEAVTSLAFLSAFFEWNWEKAEQEFQRAFALNPNYATAHHWYAEYLIAMNRTEEAIAAIVRAHEMEPLSLIINCSVGLVYFFARKYDTAIEQLHQTLEVDPNFFAVYRDLGQAYREKRMYGEAIAALEKSMYLCPDNPYLEALLGCTFAVAGEKAKSKRLLDGLQVKAAREYVSPYLIALVHTGRGEHDAAFQWLDRALEERSTWLSYLNVDPVFDCLRKDARFARLLKRVQPGKSVIA